MRLEQLPSHPDSFLSRRTTDYGLFGNVSDADAATVKGWMGDILAYGYMSVVMSALFALLSVTFFMALRHLLKDGLRSRPNKWMLAALTFMYICATLSYAFELLIFRSAVEAVTTDLTGRYNYDDSTVDAVASTGQYVVQGLNVLCGDLVIIWRTGVVWHNSTIIRRLNWLFLVLIILTWIAGITIVAIDGPLYLLIPLALSLTVNLWSTAVIGYKTWHRRRLLRRQIFMAGRSSTSAVEGALAVLTETGIAYTTLWIVYVAVVGTFFFGPDPLNDNRLSRGFKWLWMFMNMLIPLYPTLLILLIARRITPLTETLSSIDVSTVDSSSTRSVQDVQLRAVPDDLGDKIGGESYDPYSDITVSRPGTQGGSFRLEPNRRAFVE